jgi:thioredoxin reductase (NADPH)
MTAWNQMYDMIVLGGGPGGYTAALYAARAGLHVLVLEKLSAGGQMALTSEVDNYPGFPDGVDGFELGMRMQRQAERFGARTVYAEVLKVDLRADPRVIETSEGSFFGKTVVVALGAGARKLGLPGEDLLTGRGVHYCAHCDGMFYKDKVVALVGGGNSAAAEALYLSRVAKKVILIHRRDTLRATKIYHEPLMKLNNVEFRWNSAVTELLGENRLSGVRVKDLLSGEEEELIVDGLFVSIGRKPASELVQGQLALDNGYILAGESTETSIPGVYAVGDIRTKALRQIITAAADGAIAAHHAEQYLASK